jgi:tRNA_anti-like
MSRKTLRYILLIIVAGALIGAGIGYKLWTKPREKAEDVKGLVISAADLGKAFSTDENKANALYLNKAIEVSGSISEIDKNQDGGTMILLDTGDPNLPIQCTMREKSINTVKGKTVVIKGFCSGTSITGVLLTDCILTQ